MDVWGREGTCVPGPVLRLGKRGVASPSESLTHMEAAFISLSEAWQQSAVCIAVPPALPPLLSSLSSPSPLPL